MADYQLFYWPVPFRGQFIRGILAYAGKEWIERDVGEIERLMSLLPDQQPVPFMGPPVLIDDRAGVALSQMPAIVSYLGGSLGLIPDDRPMSAMTIKIVADANDVIDEITLDGGRQMWTPDKWREFVPRLRKWMSMWEATAVRHGVTPGSGHLLGTAQAGAADIVTSVLWSTMADRFPSIRSLLEETAPRTAALAERIQAAPPLAELRKKTFERYGEAYCGGEIEKSLRQVAS